MCESSGKVPHQTSASGPGDLGWSACKPWHADPWWFYLILNNQFLQFFYLRLCTLADLVNLGLQLILQGGREGLLYWNITIFTFLSFQLNRTIPTNELQHPASFFMRSRAATTHSVFPKAPQVRKSSFPFSLSSVSLISSTPVLCLNSWICLMNLPYTTSLLLR